MACTLTTGRMMALCVDSTTRPTHALKETTGSSSMVGVHYREMITSPSKCKAVQTDTVYLVTNLSMFSKIHQNSVTSSESEMLFT